MTSNYGSASGVAALAGVWTRSSEFVDPVAYNYDYDIAADAGTTPTLAQVETWLVQLSAMMDIALKDAGFITPITATEPKAAIDLIVETLVADLVAYRNQSGRFYSDKAIESGYNPMKIIQNDIVDWVTTNAGGIDSPRVEVPGNKIVFKRSNNAPIFQREAFGNVFEDWSKS